MKYPLTLLSVLLTSLCSFAAEKPNILYINIDDLGWADVSINGSKYYETPNIDRLAKEGMIFTNGYSSAANCAPSRACAISGQSTPRHGVYTVKNSDRGKSSTRKLIPTKNTLHLKQDNLTFGHALKAAGYTTATMGKWHVTKDPLKNGFDINVGGTAAGGPYNGGYHSPFKYPNLEVKEKGHYLTDVLTDKAIEFIGEHKAGPFCLYLPYFTVHSPLQAKPELVKKYKNKKATEAQNNPVYAAMIESLDQNIGRVLDALESNGITDNTLVIFTSDNGGVNVSSLQWPLRGGKGMYYEGGIREPFFIRWPEKIKAGSSCDTPVSNLDFYPTFCDVAGTSAPKGKILDGLSLNPLFEGKVLAERSLFWHFPIYLQGYGKADSPGMKEAQDTLFRIRPGSAIRHGDWKLIEYFENGEFELYNLKQDVGEKNNLAKKHPEKLQELYSKLNNWRKELNAPVPTEKNSKFEG
ncbi:sulfatase [Rubritalea profundi]|uniref:Aryl-sulfate sulfohydrolase n=1 Tax=Rubritalea profundi TaxID=1658618 RepID=A0A2S7U1S5_9BACT|nr:sulfatase [Rubritalea profundi]PQJ28344.1 aryl-sulfate sulfohydrolase [Rubritalea profundi]